MKILVGGFRQESNSFSAHISTEKTYAVIRGEEFFDPVLNPPRTMLSGILSSVLEAGAEIVPALEYTATAGGPVLQEVVDGFLREFLKTYDDNAPVQAIFLELHGATDMVPSQD
ncbi:MAG: M81 family metallopeptidase, partial [Clostridia bacterium]|nr:M81 family metallopeptidase [Clostridia bacterium]